MGRWFSENPLKLCGEQYINTTISYHECLCKFSYSNQKNAKSILKYKHCSIADDLRKQHTIDMYKIIGLSVLVLIVALIVIYCIYKWYEQTKKSPCDGCLQCFKKKKKKPKQLQLNGNRNGGNIHDNHDYHAGFDETWNINPPAMAAADLQYLTTMERRPTRPAPPPPQLPGAPGSAKYNVPMYDDGTPITDDIECEPVPEAPPSPEPVRVRQPDQPRSIYVDPLAFLQRPFLRLSIALSGKDKADGREEEEPEPLYSKVKDFVMSKVRKTGSVASLNRADGVCNNPEGDGDTSPMKGRNGRTASLASLHNINEVHNYNANRRSASLASLTGMDDGRGSHYASQHNIADEDVPPGQRDEYIDLEEMARKMAARMQNNQSASTDHLHQQAGHTHQVEVVTSQPLSAQSLHQMSGGKVVDTSMCNGVERTPDFIPASAYSAKQPEVNVPTSAPYEIGPSVLYPNNNAQQLQQHQQQQAHQPHVSTAFTHPNFSSFQQPLHSHATVAPGSSNPALSNMVPGTVVPYMGTATPVTHTPSSTMGKNKPAVPPRPSVINDNPNYKSLGRQSVTPPSPRIVEGRRPVATVVGSPSPPVMGGTPMRPTMAPPMPPPLSLHEQQMLQQQLLQQQYYMQQQQLMNPTVQQLLLQQQLQQQQEHHILSPAVQQEIYQHMIQQQQFQMQQQLLQQQYGGSMAGMMYRQPLSSTSSTASSVSSKSSRSTLTKPNHAPPPPPPSSANHSNQNGNHPTIESSI